MHFDIFRALHAVLGSPVDRGVGALRESARVPVERRHGFQNSSRRRVHVLDRRAAAAGVALNRFCNTRLPLSNCWSWSFDRLFSQPSPFKVMGLILPCKGWFSYGVGLDES